MRYDYQATADIDEGDAREAQGRLRAFVETVRPRIDAHAYAVPEAGLIAPFDASQVASALEVAENLGPVSHVVLVGIGGSSTGTEAVFEALGSEGSPELLVLDVLDGRRVKEIADMLKKVPFEEFAVVIVSKSGTTTETLANADILLSVLSGYFGTAVYRRVVCIGDPGTPLAAFADTHGVQYVAMPGEVGGRFSIFTVAGLVPLALLGVKVADFVRGGVSGIEHMLDARSFAADAACFAFGSGLKGRHTHVLFPEDVRLHGFVRWYEQLTAESLGKRTKGGEPVGVLPVPMSPRELHSTAQLYLSGFPGIFTTFFTVEGGRSGLAFRAKGPASLIAIETHTYDDVPKAIMHGVRAAYRVEGLPHAVYDFVKLTPESVGGAMAEKMLEIIFVAHLLGVDAFDQPHVELYKKETRKLLQN